MRKLDFIIGLAAIELFHAKLIGKLLVKIITCQIYLLKLTSS